MRASVLVAFTALLLAPLVARASEEALERELRLARRNDSMVLLVFNDARTELVEREVRLLLDRSGRMNPLRTLVLRARQSPLLSIRFGIEECPAFLVLDSRGRELGRVAGPLDAATVARELEEIATTRTRPVSESTRSSGSLDASSSYARGDQLWHRGDYKSAVEWYRRGLELDRARPDAGAERARTVRERAGDWLIENGRLEEALELLHAGAANEAPPRHAMWILARRATVLRRLGRTDEAVELLRGSDLLTSPGPEAPRLRLALAHLLQETGRRLEAREHLAHIVRHHPETDAARRAALHLARIDAALSRQ